MRNLLLGMLVFMGTLLSAQYYPNNGWGDNDNYYGDDQDEYFFPEDYYYEYPNDYYADNYYQDYYSDYQRSINMVNWTRFFREFALTAYQINMIMDLNRQFTSYHIWNNYYRVNPVRWYYDRFYALERILGPRIFVVFQNRYYNGYSPVVYYNNRCHNYYRPRYVVRPRYANININIYRVNRYDYHQSVGRNYGWNQTRNNNSYGFRNSAHPSENNRTATTRSQRNTAIRTNEVRNTRRAITPRVNSTTSNQSVRSTSSVRNTTPRKNSTRNSQPRTMTTPRSSSSQRSKVSTIRSNSRNTSQKISSATRNKTRSRLTSN